MLSKNINMSKVYIKKVDVKRINAEVKELLCEMGYIPKKKRIFIKPNVCGLYVSTSPCIVNPAAVEGVIQYLNDYSCKEIILGEMPVPKDAAAVFVISGYKSLCDKYSIKLLDLGKVERSLLSLDSFEITLPTFLLDGQYEYINVAKLKAHIQTTVSLCSKNQKGLLDFTGRRTMHINGDLNENIRLLVSRIKPDFCIIEGLNALEGNGPGRDGRSINKLNILILSKSIEAIDWIGSRVMGIDPGTIKHLSTPEENIEVIGEDVDRIKKNFLLPADHFRKYNIHFWIMNKTCSGCSETMAELKRSLFCSPLFFLKLLYYALFRRIDILTGDAEIPEGAGKIICLGNCMRDKARMYNLPIASGCPPDTKDLISLL